MELVDVKFCLNGEKTRFIIYHSFQDSCPIHCCIVVDRSLEPTSLFRRISYSSLGMLLVCCAKRFRLLSIEQLKWTFCQFFFTIGSV